MRELDMAPEADITTKVPGRGFDTRALACARPIETHRGWAAQGRCSLTGCVGMRSDDHTRYQHQALACERLR